MPSPDPVQTVGILLLAGVLGAVIGSFLNVCIYRLPRGESLLWPASRCPVCQTPLRWYDNIPLISYILLRGRCRYCGTPIPRRYPMVEALGALWAMAVVGGVPSPGTWGVLLPVGWAMIALAWIDAAHGILPDRLMLPVFVWAIVGTLWNGFTLDRWMGLLMAVALFGGLRYAWYALFHVEGLGGGDVKLAALWGWTGGVWTLWLGIVLATFSALMWVGFHRLKKGHFPERVYFGPFLVLGMMVGWLVGVGVDNLPGAVYIFP